MIVAGEASGDGHAAKLVNALRDAEPATEFVFFGAAGPKMRGAGVEAVVESDGLAIVGLAEIARALPVFLRASKELKNAAAKRKPDVVVLVDFPDFNLKLAKSLKKRGFQIVYYISPQLWAWRKYRISTVKKYVDLMLTILPFEKDWYAGRGVRHVEYVGNPLTLEISSSVSKGDFCRAHSLRPDRPIVSLLPGSRHKEIVRILPVMLDAAAALADKVAGVQFVVAAGSRKNRSDIERLTDKRNPELSVRIVEHETYEALAASDAAAVTSGTATLEAGILGTPMAIVYKTSAINYRLLEPLISVEHYGLINLIAGHRVAREMIQTEFTGEALANEIVSLLDPAANARAREALRSAVVKLGHGGASMRAAESILKLMRPKG